MSLSSFANLNNVKSNENKIIQKPEKYREEYNSSNIFKNQVYVQSEYDSNKKKIKDFSDTFKEENKELAEPPIFQSKTSRNNTNSMNEEPYSINFGSELNNFPQQKELKMESNVMNPIPNTIRESLEKLF